MLVSACPSAGSARVRCRWAGAATCATGEIANLPAGGHSQFFWANGTAWGTLRQKPVSRGAKAELTVIQGRLTVRTFTLTGVGTVPLDLPKTIAAGQTEVFEVRDALTTRSPGRIADAGE